MKTIIAFILLFICTVLSLFGYLPQIIQLIKTKSANDINLASWWTWVFSQVCYLSYVLLESPEAGVIAMATLSLTLMLITTFLTLYYKNCKKRKRIHG